MAFFKHKNALVDKGAKVGEGTRVWAFAHIQKGAVVGKNCNICNGTFVEKGVVVGDNVTIKHNVSIFAGVTIEDDCFIGSNIAFINDRYPRSHRHDPWTLEKTLIKKGATLGSNVTVLCGLNVGRYAMVGAGSVVTENVGDHCIYTGNPARAKGYACLCGRKLNKDHICSCGKKYTLTDKGLKSHA